MCVMMVRLTATHYIVHDQARDKIYLDMRQTFSIWFIPLYHAHVRLVTVLDLVASDGHDYHDPLNRILSYEGEGGTNGNSGHHHHNGAQGINHHDQRHNNNGSHHHQHNGSRNGTNGHHHHGPRTWKISKQEDLYQVNDFLRFMGGPGPLPFLWYFFQLSATAVCIFMSLFLSVSPWALQKEPARGGVEATIECVDDSGPDSPSSYHDIKNSDNDDNNNGNSKNGGGDSTTGGDPYAVGGGGSHNHDNHGAGSSGHANDTNGHDEHNGNGQHGHNHNNSHGHNGHRRGSSTSKTSNSSAPKKSWKNGGKRKSKDTAAAAAS